MQHEASHLKWSDHVTILLILFTNTVCLNVQLIRFQSYVNKNPILNLKPATTETSLITGQLGFLSYLTHFKKHGSFDDANHKL